MLQTRLYLSLRDTCGRHEELSWYDNCFFQTISSPLVIWLLIDLVSFLGFPLFLHLRKPKNMVVKSCWVSFDQGHLVPDSLSVALCQVQFQWTFHSSGLNSPVFLLISLFLSWILFLLSYHEWYYSFQDMCMYHCHRQTILLLWNNIVSWPVRTVMSSDRKQNFCFLKKNYIGN